MWCLGHNARRSTHCNIWSRAPSLEEAPDAHCHHCLFRFCVGCCFYVTASSALASLSWRPRSRVQWLLGGDIAPPIALAERSLWCTLGAKSCSEIWLSDTWRKTRGRRLGRRPKDALPFLRRGSLDARCVLQVVDNDIANDTAHFWQSRRARQLHKIAYNELSFNKVLECFLGEKYTCDIDIEESVVETLTKYAPRAMLDKLSSKIGHPSDVLITNKDAKVKSHHDDTTPRQELMATTFVGSAVCLKRGVTVMHAQHVYVQCTHHPCVDIPLPPSPTILSSSLH